MNNNYIYITIALLVILGLYFFVYNKPVEAFENSHITPIEFPNEGLIGNFVSGLNTIPDIITKVTDDPEIYSTIIKNGVFEPSKKLHMISKPDGTAIGFFYKIVNNFPVSQWK